MALLILLVNAKVPEMNLPDYFPILSGRFVDFTVGWYRNVGTTLVITMIVNLLMPHLVLGLFAFYYFIKRLRDRGWTRNMKVTKHVL